MRRVNFTITIALVCGMISALAADAIAQDDRPTSPESKLEKALEQKTSCSFQDAPLADVLDFFRAMSGISILVDESLSQAIEKETVSLEASELPMREILKLVLEPREMTFMVMDDCIFISTKEEIAQRQREEMLRMLENLRISLDFQGTPLPDVIAFMRHVSSTNMIIDPDILDFRDEVAVTIVLHDVSLKNALDLILKTHGLDYSVEEGYIFISSAGKIAEKKRQAKIERVQSRLRKIRVKVDMTNVRVIDVIKFLQEAADPSIKWEVALTPAYSERVISVSTENAPLLDALKTILGTVGCFCRVDEEGIFIGPLASGEEFETVPEKRVYNLSVMNIAYEPQDVIELLTLTFPELEGKVQYHRATNSLIIEATPQLHNKIERSLAQLSGAEPSTHSEGSTPALREDGN